MKKLRIPLIIVAIILTAFMLRGKIPHEKFNSEVWKTANLNREENMTLRWDMMNDLRNKYKLVGMTKKQIIDLLVETLPALSLDTTWVIPKRVLIQVV